MILLTSGAYIQEELRSEFGDIPPASLPLANQPLYVHQAKAIRESLPDQDIFLSLPDEFTMHAAEVRRLESLSITVVRVPLGLSLSNSILFALNTVGRYDEPTKILHGDTLIAPLPNEDDLVLVGHSADNYDWDETDSGSGVWAGYFAFSDTTRFIRELALQPDFPAAVRNYATKVNVTELQARNWQDLGHLNTYYAARRSMTSERSFNALKINDGIVEKSGNPPEKIIAESRWFELLPKELRPMSPAFYGYDTQENSAKYWIEYLPLAPLNELIVYGRNSLAFWRRIIELYADWFSTAAALGEGTSPKSLEPVRILLSRDKTMKRLTQFATDNHFDIGAPVTINGVQLPSLESLVREMLGYSARYLPIPGLVHGDICFSNSLYDSRNRRLRFLDPRGVPEDSNTLLGDIRYDIAKLTHSFAGFYDLIVADIHIAERVAPYEYYFTLPVTPVQQDVATLYLNTDFCGLPKNVVRQSLADTVLLFVSMLPLHSDRPSRQLGFLLNAYRLYVEHFREDLDLKCS